LGLNKSVNGLDDIIKDLNQILQTKKEINEAKVLLHLSDIISTIQSNISHLILKENVTIIVDFSEKDEIFTIKSYMDSIFYNLISNSIKYKHPERTPVIEIKSRLKDKGFEILYKDNGLGIDLEKQGNQVFGLYKRFHFHTEGKGMGLYMVKTQIETLGGKVSIKSEVNHGTEFIIEFEEK
jgi:signal transduction histidine kinase